MTKAKVSATGSQIYRQTGGTCDDYEFKDAVHLKLREKEKYIALPITPQHKLKVKWSLSFLWLVDKREPIVPTKEEEELRNGMIYRFTNELNY